MKPQTRLLKEMKGVVYDQKWLKTADPNLELYYVYRGVKKQGELRYDVTEMPSQMLGKEFVRTKGNRNSDGYPELYTVLEGQAILLMQNNKEKSELVEDVFAIEMKKGNWIIISPDYSIVAINPGSRTLKTGNWVSEKNQNIYQEIEKMNGACYFYTQAGWVRNENYQEIPELRFEKPLKKRPKSLEFLKKEE